MRAVSLALLSAFTFADAASAADLRAYTKLTGPEVRLSDLFAGLPADRDQPIGPAPAPGNRIVVERAQLEAIARQFDVDWTPVSAAARAVLERPGRPLPRDVVLGAIRSALIGAGLDPDSQVDLPAYSGLIVPAEGQTRLEVAQMDHEPLTGHFTALLEITTDEAAPVHARVSGQVIEMQDAVTVTRRIAPGAVIEASDVETRRLRKTQLHGEAAQTLAEVVGFAVKRPVIPGQPILLADLEHPMMVRKGASVLMQLDGPGLSLTGQGVASESGALGERIHVVNTTSHAVLEAEIIGQARVRIMPESMPVTQAARAQVAAR